MNENSETVNNTTYLFVKDLLPRVFCESQLFKNSTGDYLIKEKLNDLFLHLIEKNIEKTLQISNDTFNLNETENNDFINNFFRLIDIEHENFQKVIDSQIVFENGQLYLKTFQEPSYFNMIDVINKLKNKKIDEKIAKNLFLKILSVFDLFHKQNIYHITFTIADLSFDKELNLKIADFSIANSVINNLLDFKWLNKLTIKYFLAPEIQARVNITERSDSFNLAQVLFNIVTGLKPFTGINFQHNLIEKKNFLDFWKFFDKNCEYSDEFKDLFQKLIAVVPTERIEWEELIKHVWFANAATDLEVKNYLLNSAKSIEEQAIQKSLKAATRPRSSKIMTMAFRGEDEETEAEKDYLEFLDNFKDNKAFFPEIESEDLRFNTNFISFETKNTEEIEKAIANIADILIAKRKFKFKILETNQILFTKTEDSLNNNSIIQFKINFFSLQAESKDFLIADIIFDTQDSIVVDTVNCFIEKLNTISEKIIK